MTATATVGAAARTPSLDRAVANRLMATEYDRVLQLLRALTPAQWTTQTCNAGWDVRALAGHMLGMMTMAASLPEQLSQLRAAKRRGGVFIDALTAVQVEKYAHLTSDAVVGEIARLAARATKGRQRMPSLMRRRTMPQAQPVSPTQSELWTFAYLLDVILTRDPWLHRSDIARATGAELVLTEDHDALLVADVAAEWAGRHGQPCSLTLTGPAGGSWAWGEGGPSYRLDAVEFCRLVSGRGDGDGLLQTRVPF